jgi:hypothetical protein
MYIKLNPRSAELSRQQEGGEGIFRGKGGCSPVGKH